MCVQLVNYISLCKIHEVNFSFLWKKHLSILVFHFTTRFLAVDMKIESSHTGPYTINIVF